MKSNKLNKKELIVVFILILMLFVYFLYMNGIIFGTKSYEMEFYFPTVQFDCDLNDVSTLCPYIRGIAEEETDCIPEGYQRDGIAILDYLDRPLLLIRYTKPESEYSFVVTYYYDKENQVTKNNGIFRVWRNLISYNYGKYEIIYTDQAPENIDGKNVLWRNYIFLDGDILENRHYLKTVYENNEIKYYGVNYNKTREFELEDGDYRLYTMSEKPILWSYPPIEEQYEEPEEESFEEE